MSIISDWRTAAWAGNAFAGKLKSLSHYVKDDVKVAAPKITPEQQAELDRKLAERRRDHGS